MLTAEQIIKKFNDTKTLPHVAIRVSQLAGNENSTMKDFEDVIKLDPVLVTRLLRLVNSPYFGLTTRVESIAKAVVFVGMKNLRNLVAVEAIRDLYKDDGTSGDFSRRALWLHSATVAILSGMIGKRIFGNGSEELFLAGILHDIGLIVIDQVQGEPLRKAFTTYRTGTRPLLDLEREIVGADHCDVGYKLAKEWKMPEEVLKAVKNHHLHDEEGRIQPNSVTGIVQLAEYIAGKMKYGMIPDRAEPLPGHLVKHVKNLMNDYKVIVRDLPGEMEKAKQLYDPED